MAAGQHDQAHPLKIFGAEVRRYRELAELSQAQLGEKSAISSSHIGKIERGETRCDKGIARTLDEVLETRGALPSLWGKLVKGAVFPAWFDWPEVEADPATLALDSFECQVVYGLLQTPAYASALMADDREAVEARMSRQTLLTREDPPPPRISVLLAETVLLNPVGNAEIMSEQLEYLLAVQSAKISVQVVPYPLPLAALNGAFCLATSADRSELTYVETPARGMTLSSRPDIQTLSDAMADLRREALPVGMSRDHIHRVMEERWT